MPNAWIVLHVGLSAIIVVALILAVRLDPTISLILGAIYLGLAGGLGFSETVETITAGFGETMGELGLLIGFGTLLGSLLSSTGTLSWLVRALLHGVGKRGFPYALALSLGTLFPSVYADVAILLASPVVREAARDGKQRQLPRMAVAMVAGVLVGLAVVVPGLAAVAIAGIFGVPLGTMLLYSLVLGPLTVLITTVICSRVVARRWRPDRDVEPDDAESSQFSERAEVTNDLPPSVHGSGGTVVVRRQRHGVMTLSILLPVVLIATATIVDALTETTPGIIALVGSPTVALLAGALLAYATTRVTMGRSTADDAVGKSFARAGNIVLVTGAGGAFGTVVGSTSIADVLAGWFAGATASSTLVLIVVAWLVAALVHLMVGSITIAAVTAAGIVSPLIIPLGVPHVIIAMAVGMGALFAVHVNSNGFWMIRSLLGVTTSGAFKVLTFTTMVASVVGLVLVLGAGIVVT